ncbi:MAG TPA: ribose-5-phosphate isomerase RpiA [Caulobacteraceae bacterium]
MTASSTLDAEKRAAAEAAVALIDASVHVIGLGSGSTAVHFVRALPAHLDAAGLGGRVCVATSSVTAAIAVELGLQMTGLDDVGTIDFTVDGADEIGPGLACIKGAGGALLREKLVWEASRRCIVIADSSKRVAMLGRFPLSIEVEPFGHTTTLRRIIGGLADCGVAATPRLRLTPAGSPFLTDNGNYIYDAPCGVILDPPDVEAALKSITGVVDHGLFLGLAERALIGTDDGVVTVRR